MRYSLLAIFLLTTGCGALPLGKSNVIYNMKASHNPHLVKYINNRERYSGYTGSADAWNRALGGAAGTINSNMMYNQMFGNGGYSPYSNYGSLAGGGSVAMPTARPGDF